MDFSEIGKFLLLTGVILSAVGIIILAGMKLPFIGRLPGDIHFMKNNFSIHIPIVSCVIISLIITVLFNIFMRR